MSLEELIGMIHLLVEQVSGRQVDEANRGSYLKPVKATRETNTGEDWQSIIVICEQAERSEAQAREAVQILTRRITHKNVNVVLFALTVANSLVQNCGKNVRREISSRAFVDALVKQVANKATHSVVRTRILDFIQQWAEAFRSDPSLGFMVDTYNQLKAQNYSFPASHKPDLVKTQAMLDKEKEEEELQLALALSLSAQDSTTSKPATKPTPVPTQTGPKILFQVRALYDFPGAEEGELRLSRNEIIDVYDATTFQDWWKGEVRGQVGIFPSNYVEKIEGGGAKKVGESAGRVPIGGNMEAQVLSDGARIGEFLSLLASIDPKRDNLSENERLQEAYHAILLLRPKLVKLVEQYKLKQDDLYALNDRFTKASSSYHRLMEASLAQYSRPQPAGYAPQQPYGAQGYATPPAAPYPQQPYADPNYSQQYAPPPQHAPHHQAHPQHAPQQYPGY
ncbi:ESCRT-0 subunit protein hse1 [Rhizophlyctis rosea]|uniref:Class E vacuolar protein-sorting machinery protein HSE1 n=1 Tax=Rhizophlyctis rosea TaxID=64517 RepID=A0AAD5SBK0_9FUNG|nr:ESCRT-0 subunit protein hse1 [Rhizophlyctis rosea]